MQMFAWSDRCAAQAPDRIVFPDELCFRRILQLTDVESSKRLVLNFREDGLFPE